MKYAHKQILGKFSFDTVKHKFLDEHTYDTNLKPLLLELPENKMNTYHQGFQKLAIVKNLHPYSIECKHETLLNVTPFLRDIIKCKLYNFDSQGCGITFDASHAIFFRATVVAIRKFTIAVL